MKAYAGFGSRETPGHVLEIMQRSASQLAQAGWELRTGHALGADWAFEDGASGSPMEVFLPWGTYNLQKDIPKSATVYGSPSAWTAKALLQFVPGADSLQDGVQKLFRRNLHIALGWHGYRLPSFGVCWTRNGAPTGGSSLAIRVLQHHGVPVFNLGSPGGLEEWEAALDKIVREGAAL